MIVQNTIFTTDLFQIDSFYSWTCPLGEAEINLLNDAAGNSAEQIKRYPLN